MLSQGLGLHTHPRTQYHGDLGVSNLLPRSLSRIRTYDTVVNSHLPYRLATREYEQVFNEGYLQPRVTSLTDGDSPCQVQSQLQPSRFKGPPPR